MKSLKKSSNVNNNDEIKLVVENSINQLSAKFKENDNFFFTEKELHAYFYHLCVSSPILQDAKNKFSLIHSEYPTPYKYSNKEKCIQKNDSKYVRGHIDMAIINPNFYDWILKKEPENYPYYCKGILNENKKFSEYIVTLNNRYEEFMEEKNESILNTAIEFKFLRSISEGKKSSENAINLDISKLTDLQNYKVKSNCPGFVQNIRLLVFMGSLLSDGTKKITDTFNESFLTFFDFPKKDD